MISLRLPGPIYVQDSYLFLADSMKFRRVVSIILLFCLSFQLKCASSRNLPVASYDYDKLKKQSIIQVYLIEGPIYRMTNISFARTQLTGDILTEERLYDRTITIRLEEIDFIVVDKREITVAGVSQAAFIGLSIIVSIIWSVYVISLGGS